MFNPQEVIEKDGMKIFTLRVYNNIVDAKRKSMIDKFIEGQIVRMSITWKYQMWEVCDVL